MQKWARGHWLVIKARYRAENWDGDKLDAETDSYNEVFERALVEPSQSLRDLNAKAQLCPTDFEAHLFPFRKPEDNSEPEGGALMILTDLRAVIALCT